MAYVLDDDFMWGFDGYTRCPFNQQPEKPKRKYVKSGKHSKKNKAAKATANSKAQAMMQLMETINNSTPAEQRGGKPVQKHNYSILRAWDKITSHKLT